MKRAVGLTPLALIVALATTPLAAQDLTPPPLPDAPEGEATGLIEDGAQMLLRGLMEELDPAIRDLGALVTDYEPMLRDLAGLIGNIDNYQAPELLDNGDMLIRRKPEVPVAPNGPVLPDAPQADPTQPQPDPEAGDVEL